MVAAVIIILLSLVFHGLMGMIIWRDARSMPDSKLFLGVPILWFVLILIFGFPGCLAYWLVHYSTFSRLGTDHF